MYLADIKEYLKGEHTPPNNEVYKHILYLKNKSIEEKDEKTANYLWCLQQIFIIQNNFVDMYLSIKGHRFEDAWRLLERVDIELSFLNQNIEENFDDAYDGHNDSYHLGFISTIIKYYEKLFPYRVFFSRESIIKKEKCSVCGEIVSLRHGCGHKIGKVYMGEMCSREVIDVQFLGVAVVTDPFDKYTVAHVKGLEYNYEMLEILGSNINTPYDKWYLEEIKIIKPEYQNVGRNMKCPCNSGKKYKQCCLGTREIYMKHFRVNLLNQPAREIQEVKIVGTWK